MPASPFLLLSVCLVLFKLMCLLLLLLLLVMVLQLVLLLFRFATSAGCWLCVYVGPVQSSVSLYNSTTVEIVSPGLCPTPIRLVCVLPSLYPPPPPGKILLISESHCPRVATL